MKATALARLAALVSVLALAVITALLCANTASATVLCQTSGPHCTGGTYSPGTMIEANLKAGTKWSLNAGYNTFQCEEAQITGEVTGAGGQTGAAVSGPVTASTFGKCSGFVFTWKPGTFTIEHSKGSDGTFTLKGFELAAGECKYGGPAPTTLSGGSTAAISISSSVPKISGPEKCANPATVTAEYSVTSPEPLYVAGQEAATVLCKTAETPCPWEATYEEGQNLALELAEGSLFTFRHAGAFYLACSEVHIEGEIASQPGTGVDVSGPISALSFGECSHKVDVTSTGSFSFDSPEGGNGTLRLEGIGVRGTIGSGCTHTAASLPLWGGEMAGAVALINSLVSNNCAQALSWTAEFTVTEPEPLYVSEF